MNKEGRGAERMTKAKQKKKKEGEREGSVREMS